jgi:arsenate reductase (thioredoxin)
MTVLFLCRQNAGRSQMAQAFFERLAPGHQAISAGSEPAAAVHSNVVQAMAEIGIDLSGRVPRRVDKAMLDRADHVVSMGCDDPAVCEYPGRKVEDWSLEDPSKMAIEGVRRVRDEIRARVEALVARLGAASAAR